MATESQLPEAKLRAHIRHLIEQGSLPVMQPQCVVAGYGRGKRCDACDEPITRDQIAYEIEDRGCGAILGLHLGCYRHWQLDCAERMREHRTRQALPAIKRQSRRKRKSAHHGTL